MASAILANIQEEVTCPICLELLKEPVSGDCGHTFCQACIILNYESSRDQEGKGTCPVCRVSYRFENLRPNRHVANIVERLSGIKLCPAEEQTVYNCARHGEKLQLFCEKDRKVICWLCERSQEHRGHKTLLLEEVAQEYEDKLQAALKKLMTDEEQFKNWEDDLQKDRTFWQNQIQSDVQNVQKEFKQLRDILDSQEQKEMQKLKQEEEDILNSLSKSENKLVRQKKVVRNLISDLERVLEASTTEMLQDVNDLLERHESLKLGKPETIPKGQRRAFRAPDLRKVLQVFQALTEVQRYWVRVTLTQSNDTSIAVSEDQRQITYHRRRNFAFQDQGYHDGILGHPAIVSGKYYWEVDVSRKSAWLLGLNDGTRTRPAFNVKDNTFHTYSCNYEYNYKCTNYQPKCGYWVIGLMNGSTYSAFDENSATYTPRLFSLLLTNPLIRVGVFLDYEARTVSFYDVSNNGVLIYRFSACSFPKRVFPYFNLMGCPQPLKVCWPDS